MGKFWRNSFLKKNSTFLDVEQNFSAFCWTSLVGLSKLNPKRPNDILSEVVCFWNFYFFPSFLEINWKFWGLLSKKFRWARKNCILRVHRNSFKKWIFPNKYCFPSFQDIEHKNFVLFFRKISAGLSKQYLTCPSKHFDEKFKYTKYKHFRHSTKKLWLCVENFFGPAVKTELSLSIRKLWRNAILWKKTRHFRTLSDMSSNFCQKK